MIALLGDAELMRLTLKHRAFALEEAAAFIVEELSLSENDGREIGVLGLRSDDKVIGFAGLRRCNDFDADDWELGFVIGKDDQGKGYATEIGREMAQYAFTSLGKDRVLAMCHPENKGSRSVLEKPDRLGMIPFKEEHTNKDGVLRRVYVLHAPGVF